MSLLARMALAGEEGEAADASQVGESAGTGLYSSAVDFLREAVHTIYERPDQEPGPTAREASAGASIRVSRSSS